jgi:hypothetical protein
MAIQKKSLIGNMTAAKKAILATNAVSSPVLAKSANVKLAKGRVLSAKVTFAKASFAKLTKATSSSFAKLAKVIT